MFRKTIIGSLLIISTFVTFAGTEKNKKDSAKIVIKLADPSNVNLTIDSVYLIFDRYDLTGAGIIKKVFYPANNEVNILVPKGKYYIDLFCLGNYCKHFNWIVRVKTKKKNELHTYLNASAFFTPGLAFIPPEKVDFANLAVTRFK